MRIRFIEDEHKYLGDDDSEYLSVSGLIHNLEVKKDWDKIRKNYAKKHGGTAQEWKEKWETKAKKSTDAGTALHEAEEDALHRMMEMAGVKKKEVDEEKTDEGNKFTKGLEDDDVKVGDKIPGTNAVKKKDIDEGILASTRALWKKYQD
jgi:hypothetical protein